jgi:DNA ligase D-like protein (predicted ligase)
MRLEKGLSMGTDSSVYSARFIEPMLSLAVPKLPEGPDWTYEVKFDGYRALGIMTGGRVQLQSRNGRNFNARFPSIARALDALPDETVIDGEIVAYDGEGRPSFNVLQNHLSEKPPLHLYAFDLLFFKGNDLSQKPLEKRREMLRTNVIPLLPDSIRFSETLQASATEVIEAVRRLGLEGVVAKRRNSRYESGKRSGAWQKLRINKTGEFVIGGYTPDSHNFDALLVGNYQGRKLMYVAKVRAGFTPALRDSAFKLMSGLVTTKCPFRNLPELRRGQWGEGLTAEEMERCRWLKPRLLATIEYLEWTAANHLRHAKFVSLSNRA